MLAALGVPVGVRESLSETLSQRWRHNFKLHASGDAANLSNLHACGQAGGLAAGQIHHHMGRFLVQPFRLVDAQGQALGRIVVEALEVVSEIRLGICCPAGGQGAILIVVAVALFILKPEFQ